MSEIANYLTPDHRRCDDLFVEAEEAARAGDWETASRLFGVFDAAMRHHFALEENILFPSYEAQTGSTAGPSQVMRMEHDQMRDLLGAMAAALPWQDYEGYAGLADTLLVLMQQHNLKEEQILYPLCDRVLSDQSAELVSRMAALERTS